MKIRLVRAELFHVDRRMDRHDEVTFHNFVSTPQSDPPCLCTDHDSSLLLLCNSDVHV